VFRVPVAGRALSLIAAAILAVATLLMLGFAVVLLFARAWGLAAFVGAIACFMAGLTGYTLRDLQAKLGLRITHLPDRMVLDLPGGRSLIHRPRAQHLTVRYADAEAVESRLEAYSSLGTTVQRAYVLVLRTGERIFLFEDRALATSFRSALAADIAAAIVARAGVPLRDLGMVEGYGGFLAVWGAHAPDWAAPSLPLAQQLRIWRHAATTGGMVFVVIIVALAIRLIVG
jgi:hypothetical protein